MEFEGSTTQAVVNDKNDKFGTPPALARTVSAILHGVVKMKVQDIIRIQAVTIRFAAALLFASAAPAQEITNTEFPDQNTQTVQAVPNPASDAATAGVSGANAAANEAVATQEAAVAQASVMNSWLVTLMIIFVGGGTLY